MPTVRFEARAAISLRSRSVPRALTSAGRWLDRRPFANGATWAYAAIRSLLKAWAGGGVPAADQLTRELTIDLFQSADAQAALAAVKAAATRGAAADMPLFTGE